NYEFTPLHRVSSNGMKNENRPGLGTSRPDERIKYSCDGLQIVQPKKFHYDIPIWNSCYQQTWFISMDKHPLCVGSALPSRIFTLLKWLPGKAVSLEPPRNCA